MFFVCSALSFRMLEPYIAAHPDLDGRVDSSVTYEGLSFARIDFSIVRDCVSFGASTSILAFLFCVEPELEPELKK